MKEFATKVEQLGPRGYLESMAHRPGEDVDLDEPTNADIAALRQRSVGEE